MNLMITLTDAQYNFLLAFSKKTGIPASDLVYEALGLGWGPLQRRYDPPAIPPPPTPLTVMQGAYGPLNGRKLRLVK